MTTCAVPVFYASSEGQTHRIADVLADTLCKSGLQSRAIDVASPEAAQIDWSLVRGVLLGASLHQGRHQAAASTFARAHADALNARPTAFFSVSCSIASKNPEEVEAARRIARAFATEAGWRPDVTMCLAGRLAYTQYGWLTKFIMKRIARKEGGPTDTSRDHELTNWLDVAHLAGDMADRIYGRTRRQAS